MSLLYSQDHWETAIYAYDDWAYLVPETEPPSDWNTLDFDESLVYSGMGSEKNNFLIDMFLIYEDEEKAVNKYSELSPEEFLTKIDSLKSMKETLLNDINTKDPSSGVTELICAFSLFGLSAIGWLYIGAGRGS